MAVVEMDLVDYLAMSSEWSTEPVYLPITQVLGLSDEFTHNKKPIAWSQSLTLYDEFVISNKEVSETISDYLPFSGTFVKQAFEAIWYDHIAFEDTFYQSQVLLEEILFSQTWTAVSCDPFSNSLVFEDTFSGVVERGRDLYEVLVPTSNFVALVNNKYTYNIPLPVIGGPNAPTC